MRPLCLLLRLIPRVGVAIRNHRAQFESHFSGAAALHSTSQPAFQIVAGSNVTSQPICYLAVGNTVSKCVRRRCGSASQTHYTLHSGDVSPSGVGRSDRGASGSGDA